MSGGTGKLWAMMMASREWGVALERHRQISTPITEEVLEVNDNHAQGLYEELAEDFLTQQARLGRLGGALFILAEYMVGLLWRSILPREDQIMMAQKLQEVGTMLNYAKMDDLGPHRLVGYLRHDYAPPSEAGEGE